MRVVEVNESVRSRLKKPVTILVFPGRDPHPAVVKSHVLRFVLHGSVIAMTGDSVHVVKISGDAGLRAAQDIAGSLRQALAGHDRVAIATEAISGADITTIQLLLAANKQALASGKSLTLTAPPSGVLRALLIETGCLGADGRALTPDGDFWIQPTREGKAA